MTFRNYCIVAIGNTNGVEGEITKVSETKPNFFDAKGLFIATFSSFIEPNELTEWFTECGRNFMVFDLDEKNSGFNITNKTIHNGLFGFLNNINVEEVTNAFIETIPDYEYDRIKNETNKLDAEKIEKMGVSEREELLNKLIDSGLENLSENDKKLLALLVK
jgi:hypothetical protein